MRDFLRTGPLLLALGFAGLIGCDQAGNPSNKPAPQARNDSGKPGDKSAAPAKADSSSEYVLTVEGMT